MNYMGRGVSFFAQASSTPTRPFFSACCACEYFWGIASARTSDPGASIGHLRDRRMGIQSIFSRPIQRQRVNVASMLRAIASNVASGLRATSKYQRASSLLLPCCDHVVTMLRPCCDSCCVQHPTSGALLPVLLHTKPNITCL
jgi:hypothetical protein